MNNNNKGYIKLTISSDNVLSYEDKSKYINAILKSGNTGKCTLLKFNNSIGFKDLESQPIDSYGNCFIPEKVKSPENYRTPYSLLLRGLNFFDKDNEIMSFMIENKDYVHPMSTFKYNTFIMLVKFENFLYKLFPTGVKINLSFLAEKEPLSTKEFVLSKFFCWASENKYNSLECSSSELLRTKDIQYINSILKLIIDFEFDIEQYYCETCAEYHASSPYHIELLNSSYIKKKNDYLLKRDIEAFCN